uniref:Uncharacterized protein n=1 Tax=viral metagenome TaxID=1070528 RepID=A0A6C0LFE6_9ZZZZ
MEEMKKLQRSNGVSNLLENVQTVKKRDLTYDDILASMNLKVVDGELQYIQTQPQVPSTIYRQPVLATPPVRSPQVRPPLIRPSLKKEEYVKMQKPPIKTTKLLFTNHSGPVQFPSLKPTNHLFTMYSQDHPMKKTVLVKKPPLSRLE